MKRVICAIAMLALSANLALTQSTKQKKSNNQPAAQSIQPAAVQPPVTGTGTPGRISKFAAASALSDSVITEDKDGKVGIGTATPTSTLTVAGRIETTAGGFKFPDGSTMTTAGNVLTSVEHDPTLKGNGNAASPLGLAVPLIFAGNVNDGNGVITVTNVAAGGPAVFAVGGNSSPTIGGGSGLLTLGGTGTNAPGGAGLVGFGGNATGGFGGLGGSLIGGVSTAGDGGDGAFLVGALGVGTGKKGGRGLVALAGGGASGATAGLAGVFIGDVEVSGMLSKGGGSFKIDHPLDPANKYLYHSFVESPDMMNIYNGNIATDQNGEAVVELPEWFEALNKGFRYQLTVIGTFAQAIVAEKVKGNRFTIKTSAPNVEVSWQVTGIRKDAFADKHRIPVEKIKPEIERGYYLHPDAFDQPAERSIEFARQADVMMQLKAASEKVQKEKKD